MFTSNSHEYQRFSTVDCVARSRGSLLFKQRKVSNKVNFLLICASEKCHFSVRMFRSYVACEKRVIYLLMRVRGRRICHNLCSCSLLFDLIDSGPAAGLLKGRGSGETMVTLKQEVTVQWSVSVFKPSLMLCISQRFITS